jgi:hypothetical protein
MPVTRRKAAPLTGQMEEMAREAVDAYYRSLINLQQNANQPGVNISL